MSDKSNALTIPFNLEAEEAVLGSVLINPEAFYEVAPLLRAEDFYAVKHGWIWQSFLELNENKMPIDLLTVRDHLEKHDQLGDIGGPAYLTWLVMTVPTALNVNAYGRTVHDTSIRRRLLKAASEIAKLAYDKTTDIDEVVSQSEQNLFAVSENRVTRGLTPIKQVASDLFDRIQYLTDHKDEPLGMPTGFRDLDKILGGLQRSDLVIIAGRPGQGKTAWMLNTALNVSKLNKRVAFFSLEMSNEQLMQRLVSQETGINTHSLRQGELNEDDWQRFTNAIGVLSDMGIYLDDTPAISPLQLRTKSRRLAAEVQLDLIVVDYLQLMTADLGRGANRVQEVSHISRSLKTLARELNVPVLTGAQLSRGVEQRSGQRPMLSDLRESGSIEQDSDVVLFLHHPDAWDEDPQRQNVTEIIVAKHRNGPTGSAQMVFLPQLTRFVDAISQTHSLNT